jgi:hypothetical protein
LRVHIGALRKLLGESTAGVSTIAIVPGRRDSFVAPVERESVRPLLELLAGVHGRFTEGFRTADYARAGALLVDLSGPNADGDFRVSIAGAQ